MVATAQQLGCQLESYLTCVVPRQVVNVFDIVPQNTRFLLSEAFLHHLFHLHEPASQKLPTINLIERLW